MSSLLLPAVLLGASDLYGHTHTDYVDTLGELTLEVKLEGVSTTEYFAVVPGREASKTIRITSSLISHPLSLEFNYRFTEDNTVSLTVEERAIMTARGSSISQPRHI